ncbi:hypothetical protein KA119_01300 [Candidatus Gracilibacteria bacterium]|nr:hypothetical protein [Candidatus Gracilibacteria bacterium]
MKKNLFYRVIVGMLAGVALGGALIVVNLKVAYGEEEGSFWNKIVATGDGFTWNDVFGREVPKDLYLLMYKQLMTGTEDDAKLLVAKNSGYTTDELEAILNGSITPIYQNPDGGLAMTNQEALGIVLEVQQNYLDVKDLLDTSQEVEALVKPSEIFSNGSLEDSGFDLVRDLEMMEAILFVETQPVTVGKDYLKRLDSPAAIAQSVVPDVYEAEVTGQALVASEEVDVEEDFVVEVGEDEIEGRLLVADVCEPRDGMGRALEREETRELETRELETRELEGAGEDLEDDGLGLGVAQSGLEAAPPSQWGTPWCPGFPEFDGTYDNFSGGNMSGFLDGFASLGGQSPAPLFAAAGTGYESEYVELDASVCLTISMVQQTYQSYYPGQTCVLCELRKINQYLDQTLNHSLIPNKATGNLLESAKCKQTGSLFNLQFITMFQPVMQPPNDQLIFGNDIFEEWDKFTKRYQPLLFKELQLSSQDGPDVTAEGLARSLNIRGGDTQLDVLNKVREAQAYYEAEGLSETGRYPQAQATANKLFYDQTVLSNMQEMNQLFNALKILFDNINNGVLPAIEAKPDLG